ncbi:hypothetical protein QJS10_CPB12g00993 [Acorus calamus]|uniref:Uncharacterized protein n=1 Tax=Acorus calamus TaxID=4465 RepID=A0AAV9DMJ4_ACOCL|nr:hypothetical protein QJS10_CPB12g00993 [Acorus calamus]
MRGSSVRGGSDGHRWRRGRPGDEVGGDGIEDVNKSYIFNSREVRGRGGLGIYCITNSDWQPSCAAARHQIPCAYRAWQLSEQGDIINAKRKAQETLIDNLKGSLDHESRQTRPKQISKVWNDNVSQEKESQSSGHGLSKVQANIQKIIKQVE